MWGRPTRSATAGFDGINLVTGLVLVVVVLLFRRGLLGTPGTDRWSAAEDGMSLDQYVLRRLTAAG